jgi:lysophospholipase L1-like esterase
MKKIFLFIGLLVTLFAGAQLPTIPGFTNINQKYQWVGMKPPPDTTYSKYGFAQIGDTIYVGNGTRWLKSLFYVPTDQQPGDQIVIDPTNNFFVNQRPSDQSCNNTSTISLSYVSGLTYAFNSGPYSIACIQYIIKNPGNITAANGTASAGEFRLDRVYLDASGVHIRQGDNSVAGVGLAKDVDPATEISLGIIRIDQANTFPTGPVSTLAYDENNAATEFSHTLLGAPTINFSYNVNAENGDTSIRVTAAGNNTGFYLISPSVLSQAAYTKISFWVRNNNTFAAARNWVVTLFNGATQVAGSNQVTLTTNRGYQKGTLNTWQLISFDLSAFGGSDAFDRIQVRNTGTGGTVNVQFDYFRLEAGVVTTTGNAGVQDVYQRNDSLFKIINGVEIFVGRSTGNRFGHVDSVGAEIDYPWTTGSVPSSVWTSSGTITPNGTTHRFQGTASLTSTLFTGVEDWDVYDTIQSQVKANSQQDYEISFIPDYLDNAFSKQLILKLADTAGYWNYYNNYGSGVIIASSRATSKLVWSAANTFYIHVSYRKGHLVANAQCKQTGAVTILDYTADIIANNSQIKVGSVGGSADFYHTGRFKYIAAEPKNVSFVLWSHSMGKGTGAITIDDRHLNQTFANNTNIYVNSSGPSEYSTIGLNRSYEIFHFINPDWVGVFHGTNDLSGGRTAVQFSTDIRKFLDSVVHYGKRAVIYAVPPMSTSNVTYNDSLRAMSVRYGFPFIDIDQLLRSGSAGSDRAAIVDADGIHFNNLGNKIIAEATRRILDSIGMLRNSPTIVVDNAAISSDVDYVMGVKSGQARFIPSGVTNAFIRNYLAENAATAQRADITTTGKVRFFASEFYVVNPLTGSLTNYAMRIRNDSVSIANGFITNLFSENLFTGNSLGAYTQFNGGQVQLAGGVSFTCFDPANFRVYAPNSKTEGFIIDNFTGTPASSYHHLAFKNNGTVTGWVTKRGGIYGDSTHGYTRRIPYAEFGASDIYDKATTDSLIAAASGSGVTASSTTTFTNKRWTARVGSTTSSATPTINTDNVDIYKLTAQTADITSFTTNLSGTPVDGDILEVQITGTAARAITWGSSFVSSTVTLPTTTVTTATLTVIFQYYTTSSYGNNKWTCVNSF